MTTLTATKARARLFKLVRQSVKTHQPCKITSKGGDVVLMGEADYESLLETLELLSTPGVLEGVQRARRDIQHGRTKTLKEFFGD